MADKKTSGSRRALASRLPPALRPPSMPKWARTFLAELAATSNVSAAARAAGIDTARAYETRRAHAEFNRLWHEALAEGYDLLELELLRRARGGPEDADAPPISKTDNATALKLLTMHRDSVGRQRAVRNHQDSAAIIASIEAKLALIRERRLAAKRREREARKQANDHAQKPQTPDAAAEG